MQLCGSAGSDTAAGPFLSRSLSVMLLHNGAVVREALRSLIEEQPDLAVVAQGATLGDVVGLDVAPDVVITDIAPPAGAPSGDVILGIRASMPDARILVLSFIAHPVRVRSVLAAGASGYVLKTAAIPDFLTAIRAVGRGDTYLQPSVRGDLERWPLPGKKTFELTLREEQVLRFLAAGYTNSEVASHLEVSIRTVETHRSSIQRKCGLRTRAELFRYAWDVGLLERDPGAPVR